MSLALDVALTEEAGGWPAGTRGMAICGDDTTVDVMPYDRGGFHRVIRVAPRQLRDLAAEELWLTRDAACIDDPDGTPPAIYGYETHPDDPDLVRRQRTEAMIAEEREQAERLRRNWPAIREALARSFSPDPTEAAEGETLLHGLWYGIDRAEDALHSVRIGATRRA